MTLEEILAGESKNLEFKVRRPKESMKYMKSVVAFANGEGGTLVFGVSDDDQVVGLVDAESDAERISEAIKTKLDPIPSVNLEFKEVNDKKLVLLNKHPYISKICTVPCLPAINRFKKTADYNQGIFLYIKNIENQKMNEALRNLTDVQLRRIELHIVNEFSIRDIAKIENVKKRQVEKSLQLGLKKIKKFFEK